MWAFASQAGETLLEKDGSTNPFKLRSITQQRVRHKYTSNQSFISCTKLKIKVRNSLHIRCRISYVSILIVIKVHVLNLPISIKVQNVGFQNQAGETLLEKGGSASVHDYVHANRTFQVRFRCDVEYAPSA